MAKKIITSANLSELESHPNISILKFSAEWCGPCQMFKPIYSEAAIKYEDILFGEVDIDEDEAKPLMAKFNISSVPTTIIFKDGVEAERFSGYLPLEKFEAHINKHK
ncbi:MAG: thioredoxin family protein [Mycoplasmoidaceae bacterium]